MGMTKEEAKAFLTDISYDLGTVGIEYLSVKDGEKMRDAIETLEQEPKTGHWIAIDEEPHEVWECDHCGFVIDGSGCIDPYDYRDTYKFCPNCGAKMVD